MLKLNISKLAFAFLCMFAINANASDSCKSTSTNEDVSLLSQDKIWEYVLKEQLDDRNIDYTLTRYKLGDKVNLYGKDYLSLVKTDIIFFTRILAEEGTYKDINIKTETKNSICALLRESGNTVYVLLESYFMEEGQSYSYFDEYNPNIPDYPFSRHDIAPGEEAILYDFNAKEGECISNCVVRYCEEPWDYGAILSTVDVISVDETDEPYRKIMLSEPASLFSASTYWDNEVTVNEENVYKYGIIWQENVGSIGNGLLHMPGGFPGIEDEYADNYTIKLNNVYDSEGNILFCGANITCNQTGDSPIIIDDDDDDVKYDLFGRKLVNPEPGTICIYRGHKYICSCHK